MGYEIRACRYAMLCIVRLYYFCLSFRYQTSFLLSVFQLTRIPYNVDDHYRDDDLRLDEGPKETLNPLKRQKETLLLALYNYNCSASLSKSSIIIYLQFCSPWMVDWLIDDCLGRITIEIVINTCFSGKELIMFVLIIICGLIVHWYKVCRFGERENKLE